MPSKKKKYNARFPPARIKKIMQSDEEVGKVAQAVPVIISRALELFVESLLKKAETVTNARNAKTLTPSHLKQCILAEQRFDFLKDLVGSIPDVQGDEESAGAETPRSSSSNSPFVFPPASATATSSSACSTMSSPVTGPPTYDQRFLSQSSERPSSVSTYDPNQVDYRHLNPLMTFSNPPPAHYHHESVIVSHSSILNPVGANSNPYIPIHHTPVQLGVSTSLPSQQLTMSQQFEYHLQHNLNLNPVMGDPNSSIPLSLAVRNSGSPNNTQGVAVYDNNVSHALIMQPQFKQESD